MNVLLDFIILSVFLGIGWFIRERIIILQRLFIPASVIGGLFLLILGPQVLQIVEFSEGVKKLPSSLIIIILTGLIFGCKINKDRIRSYMDYTAVTAGTYGAQLFFGVGIGYLLSLVWTSMPPNWGIISIFGFFAGHGAAGSAAQIYIESGYDDFMGIAMIVSTVGLVGALLIGMPLLNWGIRKGYGRYVDKPEKLPSNYFRGVLSEEDQVPIGVVKTTTAGLNPLALQMFFLALCIMIGFFIKNFGGKYISEYFFNINDLVLGIIGAVLLWPFMIKTGSDKYVDKRTISSISGFALEFLIIAAVGTLSVDTMGDYMLPIVLYCILMFIILTPLYLFLGFKLLRDEWFEKMINMFGQSMGNAATGLTLLRSVDPKSESCAGDANGVALLLFTPIWVGMIVAGPMIALSDGGTLTLMLIGAGLMFVFYSFGFFLKKFVR